MLADFISKLMLTTKMGTEEVEEKKIKVNKIKSLQA